MSSFMNDLRKGLEKGKMSSEELGKYRKGLEKIEKTRESIQMLGRAANENEVQIFE
jgi:hypothetical protein